MTTTNMKKLAVIIGVGMTVSMFQNCSKVNFNPVTSQQDDQGASAVGVNTGGGLVPIEVVTSTPSSAPVPTATPVIVTTTHSPSPTPMPISTPVITTSSSPSPTPKVTESQPPNYPPIVEPTDEWENKYCSFDLKKVKEHEYKTSHEGNAWGIRNEVDDDDDETRFEREDLRLFIRGWAWGLFKNREVFHKCLKIRLARFCKIKVDLYEQFIDIAQLSEKDAKELNVVNGKVLLYSSDTKFSLDDLKIGDAVKFVGLCHIKVKNCHNDNKEKLHNFHSRVEKTICKAPERDEES